MNSKVKTFLSLVDLPSYESVELELKKVGLLRWALGAVVFVRMAQIYDAYLIFNGGVAPSAVVNSMTGLLLAIAFFTLGFFTQFATICVGVGVVLADAFFKTTTLGTDVLSGVLFMLFLINSGQFYSIDALILRSTSLPAKAVAPFLRFVGVNTLWDLRVAYITGLLFYALLSFVALSFHLDDSYWLEGRTTKTLLMSAYLSKFYWFFRALDSVHPSILSVISIVGGIGQSIFQFLMIPLMFSRIGRYFVFIWGLVFILISLVNINLSYLPHIELILWILIFCPVVGGPKRVEIFFDDSCRFCSRTMRVLKLLNYNGRLVFSPLSGALDKLSAAGVSEEGARKSIYGFTNGRIFEGYDLYVKIAKRNVLLWPLIPVLLLGYLGGIGPRVYRYIAARRSRGIAACLLGPKDSLLQSSSKEVASVGVIGRYVRALAYIVFTVYAVIFLLVSLPPWRKTMYFFLGGETFQRVVGHLHLVGFEAPFVFNAVDLKMGDQWLELYSREGDSWELVPLTSPDGVRLNYAGFDWLLFANHNSDFIYFSHALPFRRGFISIKDNYAPHFERHSTGEKVILFRVRYDYRHEGRSGTAVYRAVMRRNRASDVKLWESDPSLLKADRVFQQDYTFDLQNGLTPIPGTMVLGSPSGPP